MRIVIRWKTTLLLCALALAACGKNAAEENSPATTVPAAERTAPSAETPAMDSTGAPAAEKPVAAVPAPLASTQASAGETLHSAVADGTAVRIESSYLESGWLEGRLGPSPSGCRMVFLDKPTDGGYTSVALMTLKRLERKDGAEWREVAVQPLLDREPAHCLEAAAD